MQRPRSIQNSRDKSYHFQSSQYYQHLHWSHRSAHLPRLARDRLAAAPLKDPSFSTKDAPSVAPSMGAGEREYVKPGFLRRRKTLPGWGQVSEGQRFGRGSWIS